jgi:hypothetical protein
MSPEIGVPKAAKMPLGAQIGRFLPPNEPAREALAIFQTVSPRTPLNKGEGGRGRRLHISAPSLCVTMKPDGTLFT